MTKNKVSLEEKIRLIMAIDSMVNRKVPGNAHDYAAKLQVSRSTFFRLLRYMRTELCAPVTHDKASNQYNYEVEGKIFFGFLPDHIVPKALLKRVK